MDSMIPRQRGYNGFVMLVEFCLIGLLVAVVGCSARQGGTSMPAVGEAIDSILILPFQTAAGKGKREGTNTVRCFECPYFVQTGPIEDNASEFMNHAVISYLKSHFPFEVIPFWKAPGVSPQMLSQDLRGADKRLLVQLGKNLGADAVLRGTIYRFQDRVGTSVSVTTPASVAFAMELIRVSDGKTLWSRPYDETQRSLDENLFNLGFFLQSKGRWLTAEELATLGLKQTMSTFPMKRPK